MSDLQLALALILGAFALAGIVGGLWAAVRYGAQDARIKRLQDERDDYLTRLNYIEPKLTTAEEQNKLLLEMHNPAEQIERLRRQEQTNHDRTVTILQEQAGTLAEIKSRVHPPRSGGG